MIVHFGLHLDGMQPVRPATAAGELTAGPLRMLETLETALGLAPVRARPGEALLAYRRCLAECDDFARFYHLSFARDALGVARTLLGWRNLWHEAGWRGALTGAVSARLSDLAAVERLARERVPLDVGQRVQRAAAALAAGLESQIERVVLHDPPEQLPAAWRALIAHLQTEIAPGVVARPRAPEGSDLRRVQQTLLELAADDRGVARERERLAGDGSFLVLRGVSRDLTAQAIGEYLLATRACDDTVVIAERDGIIVDNALERVGLARAGFQHYSRFRAVTQVLKLCLGLVWKPVSPQLLLQFLVHPVGPLPDQVRSRLADAVAAEPGVGGHAWQAALAEITLTLTERHGASDAEVRELGAEISYWLECERYSPEHGAPLETLTERTRRCAAWLVRRLRGLADSSEADLYAAAEAQCEALLAALAALASERVERLPRIALEQLVDEVSGHAPDPSTFAEAGHARATTHPATLTSAWPRVIWWDLEPQAMSWRYPWSEREHAALLANGVMLPSVAERIRTRSQEWLRPVMAAAQQLILVIHERDHGRHPLVGALASAVEGWREIGIEEALLGGNGAEIAGLDVATRPLPVKPLPLPRRWWRLPSRLELAPRAIESYSSLQKLIDYPHQWALKYAARLRPGRASDLARGNLLYGNLAHRLFESFFVSHPRWRTEDDAALSRWLAATLPALLEREGAVLGEPGAGLAREQVLATLEAAFGRLLAHLRGADIERIEAERWLEAPFASFRIRGGIDLLAWNARGVAVVLDAKWSGQERRGEELEQSRALQLATYGYLCRAGGATERWPAHAYFIVSSGNIVAPDTEIFPDALVYPPENGESLAALWQRIAATIEWRWQQLAAGAIECNAAGTDPEPTQALPPGTLAPAASPDPYDEFTWLTGWEEGV